MKVIFNPYQMGVTSLAMALVCNCIQLWFIGVFLIGLGIGLRDSRGGDR